MGGRLWRTLASEEMTLAAEKRLWLRLGPRLLEEEVALLVQGILRVPTTSSPAANSGAPGCRNAETRQRAAGGASGP